MKELRLSKDFALNKIIKDEIQIVWVNQGSSNGSSKTWAMLPWK
jgi:hypothetical protein